MTEKKQINMGEFCWTELATPNLEKSTQFYCELLGFETETHAMPNGENYEIFKLLDSQIGGAFQINQEMANQGMQPHWHAYIAVDDVDGFSKKAHSLGAVIFKAPFDVMDFGRMAVIQDPTKAVFSLWKSKHGLGEQPIYSTPGMACWHELITDDLNTSRKFYSDLFEWEETVRKFPGGHTYISFMQDKKGIGGLMEKTETMKNKHCPNHWRTYFTTTDFDASLHKIKSLGGALYSDPMEIPDVGRIIAVKDPEGVHFSLIQFPKK